MKWSPPPSGFIKLNFDKASRGNLGKSSIAAILRNWKGEFISATCGTIPYGTNNVAELKALSVGLKIASELSISQIVIESDSMITISALKKGAWTLGI